MKGDKVEIERRLGLKLMLTGFGNRRRLLEHLKQKMEMEMALQFGCCR
jgi:GGDEF domain-containing protein